MPTRKGKTGIADKVEYDSLGNQSQLWHKAIERKIHPSQCNRIPLFMVGKTEGLNICCEIVAPGLGIGISSVFAVLESVALIARVESAGSESDSDERFSQ
ncbi:hypothetical protein ACFE04_008285 [Oxalis oulophora]